MHILNASARAFCAAPKKRFYGGTLLVLAGVSDENDPWWDGEEKVLAYLAAGSSESKRRNSWFSWNALELRLLHLEEMLERYTFADRSISRTSWREVMKTMANKGPLESIEHFWEIDHLSVDVAHQGKGIGKMMVRHVFDLAEKDSLPVILVASKQGKVSI